MISIAPALPCVPGYREMVAPVLPFQPSLFPPRRCEVLFFFLFQAGAFVECYSPETPFSEKKPILPPYICFSLDFDLCLQASIQSPSFRTSPRSILLRTPATSPPFLSPLLFFERSLLSGARLFFQKRFQYLSLTCFFSSLLT